MTLNPTSGKFDVSVASAYTNTFEITICANSLTDVNNCITTATQTITVNDVNC